MHLHQWDMEMKSYWQIPIFLQGNSVKRRVFSAGEGELLGGGFFHCTVVLYIAYSAVLSLFSSMCSGGAKYISAHGHNIPDLLEAVMKYFPLDTYNYSKHHCQHAHYCRNISAKVFPKFYFPSLFIFR